MEMLIWVSGKHPAGQMPSKSQMCVVRFVPKVLGLNLGSYSGALTSSLTIKGSSISPEVVEDIDEMKSIVDVRMLHRWETHTRHVRCCVISQRLR